MCVVVISSFRFVLFFFFNDTATTEIYTLSLHDALPICSARPSTPRRTTPPSRSIDAPAGSPGRTDRKSTRLNSSHVKISYAVFCLKKKKKQKKKAYNKKKKKKKKKKEQKKQKT